MMKRIMFMTNSMYGGGAEKVLQTLLHNLDRTKYDVTVYSMHDEEIRPECYPADVTYKAVFGGYHGKSAVGKQLHSIMGKIKGKLFLTAPSWLFYLLYFHEKYDVEVAFIEGEAAKIISGSTNKNSRKIAWVHTDLQENPWTDFLYKSVEDESEHYQKFDSIVCVSDRVRESFLRKYRGVTEEKVLTHYNPIDSMEIKNKAGRIQVQKNEDIIDFVAVGRLVEQKGFDRLIEACGRLINSESQWHLRIVGDGEQRENLVEIVKRLQLEKNITFCGFQENPYPIMNSSDVLVCSSRAEGYSLVIAEAMVLGLAIITTECAGPTELIRDGEYGCLVENSVDGIYQGLDSILRNKTVMNQYKEKSAIRGEQFDISSNMYRIERILNGELNNQSLPEM